MEYTNNNKHPIIDLTYIHKITPPRIGVLVRHSEKEENDKIKVTSTEYELFSLQ